MNYFGCSRYMIDQARKMKSESGPGVVAPKGSFTRNKLDLGKVEHFIEFFYFKWIFSRRGIWYNNT